MKDDFWSVRLGTCPGAESGNLPPAKRATDLGAQLAIVFAAVPVPDDSVFTVLWTG